MIHCMSLKKHHNKRKTLQQPQWNIKSNLFSSFLVNFTSLVGIKKPWVTDSFPWKLKLGNVAFLSFFLWWCSEVLGSSNLLHLTKRRRQSLCDVMVLIIVKSVSALSSNEAKLKRGEMGARQIKRSHAHSKNAVWFAFYCVQMRVHKRADPARSKEDLLIG